MWWARNSDGTAPEAGRSRARGYRRGYGVIGYLVIGIVVLAILAGGVALAMMVMNSTTSQEATPGPAPSSIGQCPSDTWYDSAATSCVPKAVCREGENYQASTNTCVVPPPRVVGIAPASGPVEGGTKVTISGTGFAPGATVLIDRIPAIDVVVESDTVITATTPASDSTYPVDIEVQNPEGPPALLDNAFTFRAPPVKRATAVNPPTGSKQGGEAVIIKGTGFVDGVVVAFGGRAATEVIVLDRATLRVTTPFGRLGPTTVNVRLPGQDPYLLENAFEYVDQPPRVVRAVRPLEGAQSGGTKITIAGTGFAKGATVTVGKKRASKVKVVSSTRITAVTPAGELGPAVVGVRNPGLPAAFLADAFTFVEAPTITGLTPGVGSDAGGTEVTIAGTGFLPGAKVTFGGAAAKKVKVKSSTTITVVTPKGKVGPVAITVKNAGQPIATLKKGFEYFAAPTITGVSPAEGPEAGRTTVTIRGTGFAAGAKVTFGGVAATGVKVNSATSITAVTPKGKVGPVAVRVLNKDKSGAVLRSGFAYVSVPAKP